MSWSACSWVTSGKTWWMEKSSLSHIQRGWRCSLWAAVCQRGSPIISSLSQADKLPSLIQHKERGGGGEETHWCLVESGLLLWWWRPPDSPHSLSVTRVKTEGKIKGRGKWRTVWLEWQDSLTVNISLGKEKTKYLNGFQYFYIHYNLCHLDFLNENSSFAIKLRCQKITVLANLN